jgi:Zn finger protein HypA/HybF involved in hydrogenase expression
MEKVKVKCIECGAVFTRKITAHTYEIECPKCHGVDTEID